MNPNNLNEFNTNNPNNGSGQPVRNRFFNLETNDENNNVGSTISQNTNNVISWGVGKKNPPQKVLIELPEVKDVNSTIYNGDDLEVLEIPALKEGYKEESLEVLDEPELPKLNNLANPNNFDKMNPNQASSTFPQNNMNTSSSFAENPSFGNNTMSINADSNTNDFVNFQPNNFNEFNNFHESNNFNEFNNFNPNDVPISPNGPNISDNESNNMTNNMSNNMPVNSPDNIAGSGNNFNDFSNVNAFNNQNNFPNMNSNINSNNNININNNALNNDSINNNVLNNDLMNNNVMNNNSMNNVMNNNTMNNNVMNNSTNNMMNSNVFNNNFMGNDNNFKSNNNNNNNNFMGNDLVNGNMSNNSMQNNASSPNMMNNFFSNQSQPTGQPMSLGKDNSNNMGALNIEPAATWMNAQPLSANSLGGGSLDEANKPKDVDLNSRFFNKNINKNLNKEQNQISTVTYGNGTGVVLEEPAPTYNEMDLLKAYVGQNLTKLSMSIFSFPTFLFGGLVFLYRKMYLIGGILTVIESAIVSLLPLKFSILIVLALHIFLALFINSIYLKKAKMVVHHLATNKRNFKLNQVELSVIARKRGGHNLIIALIFYFVVSGLVSFFIVRFK